MPLHFPSLLSQYFVPTLLALSLLCSGLSAVTPPSLLSPYLQPWFVSRIPSPAVDRTLHAQISPIRSRSHTRMAPTGGHLRHSGVTSMDRQTVWYYPHSGFPRLVCAPLCCKKVSTGPCADIMVQLHWSISTRVAQLKARTTFWHFLGMWHRSQLFSVASSVFWLLRSFSLEPFYSSDLE